MEQALKSGHNVTVLARQTALLNDLQAQFKTQLTIIAGDATKQSDVEKVLFPDTQAVLVSLGSKDLKPTTNFSDSMRAIVAAMQKMQVKRILFVTSAGLNDNKPLFTTLLVKLVLQNVHDDLARAEKVLVQSDLQYTIVRPPRLVDGPLTKKYNTTDATKAYAKGSNAVTRADVAHLMLSMLSDSSKQIVMINSDYKVGGFFSYAITGVLVGFGCASAYYIYKNNVLGRIWEISSEVLSFLYTK